MTRPDWVPAQAVRAFLISGVAQLPAAPFAHFIISGQNAIHSADRAQIDAFIEQAGIDFGGCQIDEAVVHPTAREPPGARHRQARAWSFGRGRAALAGRLRRWRLARDRPSAAQLAPIRPLPGARAATASIGISLVVHDRKAQQGRYFFLKVDNRLSTLQSLRQTPVVAQ